MAQDSGSNAKIKMAGETGQTRRVDLKSWKGWDITAFVLTQAVGSWYNALIHHIHVGVKPNLDNTWNKKGHSILSKAFSASNDTANAACWRVEALDYLLQAHCKDLGKRFVIVV